MFKVETEMSQRVSIDKTFLVKKLIIPIILICLFFSDGLYADAQFDINLDNGGLADDNTYEFDVVIKSNEETFTLTSYQASFVFNQDVINGGKISFLYIEGTSELSNVPSVGIGLNLTDGIPKLTFASLPGEDLINSNYIKIGRFRLHNTNSYGDLPSIRFNFDGRITTILTGNSFADITNLSNHFAAGIKDEERGGDIPDAYILGQNYPNPFNPSTNIELELKEDANVKLAVYNVLGEEVAELFNGEINAGTHKFVFNAADLASGVYVYRLYAGKEFTETKKMVLMR
jgi:hypothetical protein